MLQGAVPIIDVSPLLSLKVRKTKRWSSADEDRFQKCIQNIRKACVDVGFFYVINHGIDESLQRSLEILSKKFFSLPIEIKNKIRMSLGGKAWRGYFQVGEELTSGVVDQKEGIYFGEEVLEPDVRPLHGKNIYLETRDFADSQNLKNAVENYMGEVTKLARTLLSAIAVSIGLSNDHFEKDFRNPTKLFRVFHYPPHDKKWGTDSYAVGEHTDYGYLTVLKQDDTGGLQIKREGKWIDAAPIPKSFVINIGDALQFCTGGLLRAVCTICFYA